MALKKLVKYLYNLYKRPLTLVGHEDIAMPLGRKTDPGPLFPWHEFRMTTILAGPEVEA